MIESPAFFYNTLSQKKEIFIPLINGEVRMYTCGPTVYSYAHIGNFRTFIFEDLLRRYLKVKGYKVTQVMNITDVDDKTIKNSMEQGVSLEEYTKKYEKAFFDDLEILRIEKAEHYPRATEHVDEMINLIKSLEKNKVTYKKDGSTYFRISEFKDYGKLSKIDFENVISGSRYDSDEYEKEDVRDFVLWKKTDSESGEPSWDSPFGVGRPGWHIECSAMSMKYLGNSFDIHTGGVDNIFPHHENEIAQVEACTGKKFVNYWLHAEHLKVDNQKMSKSLGNFYTLRDLSEFNPLAIRYLLLSSHYRAKMNFTLDGVRQAETTVKKYNEFLRRVNDSPLCNEVNGELVKNIVNNFKEFIIALDDDLNISKALGHLFIMIRDVNSAISDKKFDNVSKDKVDKFINVFNSIVDIEENQSADSDNDEIEKLIAERNAARNNRDFKRADEIRDILKDKNIVIQDGKEKTTWYVDGQ
ncbi:MAG: cysteine--tRNA ligase [Candidatus Muirbacterium halophilum]|nr:cysteine--tRNA ligase [Candidatus Muirbacterium halophilum]MCK9477683.1 cysteine--tRNA ligase [Candidatus Muirbacterium halophilum]